MQVGDSKDMHSQLECLSLFLRQLKPGDHMEMYTSLDRVVDPIL